MKKWFLLLVSLMLLGSIAACQTSTLSSTTTVTSSSTTTTTTTTSTTTTTTTTSTTTTTTSLLPVLASPTNVQIVEGILTFDHVTNAESYRLYVFDSASQPVKDFPVQAGFDLLLELTPGDYQFLLRAEASNYQASSEAAKFAYEFKQPVRISVLEEEGLNDESRIRWMGRTYYNPSDRTKYFYFTASGFEVSFYGTELKAFIKGTNPFTLSRQAHLVVFVNGEEDPTKGSTLVLNQTVGEYTLVSGLPLGYHTVKVLKRSESIDSNSSLMMLETNGHFVNPPQAKPFHIEYIAASSSTGYGNLGSLSQNKNTENSHGLLGFAYLTSYLLDAETSIFAASGWGVTRGYNTGGSISETQTIPEAYKYVAIPDNGQVFTTPGLYDLTKNIPDVVVVNLGTNDFNSSNYNNMSNVQREAVVALFVQTYTAFLVSLHTWYPDAVIVVAYGLMNEAATLGAFTLQVIEQANTSIGSEVVVPFLMEAAGSNGNAYGSNYHPNVQTSMNVASALATLIATLTDRDVVRDMVSYLPN